MFLQFPDISATNIQEVALIANTVLLILFIVAAEFGIAELPPEKRKNLRFIQPFVAVFALLFIFAAFSQGRF